MESKIEEQFAAVAPMIGNTPLLEIRLAVRGEERRVYAKAEYYNLTGSIKDRVAYTILHRAYESGAIAAGDLIAEATSGNTGIAFSALGRYLGHPVVIFMPDWMSEERINLMKSFGAEVRLVSRAEGGFLGSIQRAEDLAKQGGVFLPRQFSNTDNSLAHEEGTGAEIVRQLESLGLRADGFVAGVGTGGTVMGVGQRLRAANCDCAVFPLEPSNSPTLSTGYKVGIHRIAGISDEFIPDLIDLPKLDGVISVDDTDAIIMARQLSECLGLGVGISSGANLIGALMVQDRIGTQKTTVTVFADDNKKYLSTDYSHDYCKSDGAYTKDVELLSFRAIV